MNTFKKHIHHYFPLIGILIASYLGFYYYPTDLFFRVGISVALAVSYVVWGIIHHTIHGDISLSVVLEYIVVAIIGLILIMTLLYWQ